MTKNPLCMICKKEFDHKMGLYWHLRKHTKKEMINSMKNAVMYHN
jgi:hypothetical protein